MKKSLEVPPLPNEVLGEHFADLVDPVPGNHNPADDVDQPHQELDKRRTGLGDAQRQRLDVVLEKDARNLLFVYADALLGNGVLVCHQAAAEDLGVVDGGNYREEVLEFEEVCLP